MSCDVIDDYKIKTDKTRLKMKIKRYAIEKEMCLLFALVAVVILGTYLSRDYNHYVWIIYVH